MLFNSLEFLIFFPTVTIIYFLLPQKWRWLHLLIASCIFYSAFIPVYLLILSFTTVVDYIAGIFIEKAEGRKRALFLIASLTANVGVLALFKYGNFLTENVNFIIDTLGIYRFQIPYPNIILPIGLSFHTFQAMSYTIEVYRGNQKAERHFGIFSLYVMFYPQLVAGPIERPQNLLGQFREKFLVNYERIRSGLLLMLWGFIQKVVIADRLALYADPVFNNAEDFYGLNIWIAGFFFSFQVYCDFSGYTDIARGIARVMGFELMKNFIQPFHALTLTEFWSRWHISLTSWFRDYVFVPLGGSRVKSLLIYRNLLFAFTLSGLWHGANWTFVFWGAINGVFVALERIFASQYKVVPAMLRRLITFGLFYFGAFFFRAPNIEDVITMFINGFDFSQPASFNIGFFKRGEYDITKFTIIVSFLVVAFLLIVNTIQYNVKHLGEKFFAQPIYIRWAVYYGFLIAIFELGVFGKNQFIYFQF